MAQLGFCAGQQGGREPARNLLGVAASWRTPAHQPKRLTPPQPRPKTSKPVAPRGVAGRNVAKPRIHGNRMAAADRPGVGPGGCGEELCERGAHGVP